MHAQECYQQWWHAKRTDRHYGITTVRLLYTSRRCWCLRLDSVTTCRRAYRLRSVLSIYHILWALRMQVYRAVEVATNQRVAIKQFRDGTSSTEIANEIKILKRCQHPNINKFHGMCTCMQPYQSTCTASLVRLLASMRINCATEEDL